MSRTVVPRADGRGRTWTIRRRAGAAAALLLAAGLRPSPTAAAPVMVALSGHSSYTDNLFQSYSERSDWIHLAYVDLDYRHRAGLDLHYSSGVSAFAEYSDLATQTHRLSLTYRPGEQDGGAWATASAGARLGRAPYDYRDYVEGAVALRGRGYLAPSLLLAGSTSLRYREYPRTQAYSYVEHRTYARLSRFLLTRTTLQVTADLGVKVFARDGVGVDPDEPVPDTRTQAQVLLRAKVAQSVAARTGLQLAGATIVKLAGRQGLRDPEAYDPDGDLFDDRYSYQGGDFRLALKHAGRRDLDTEVSLRWQRRRYDGRPALDLSGEALGPGETRVDRRRSLAVSVSKVVLPQRPSLPEMRWLAEWMWLDVDSTDPYYSARTGVYSVGLELGF